MQLASNNPNLTSWVDVPAESDFPIQNLPFGIFSSVGETPRVGVAIGNQILDLRSVAEKGFLEGIGIPASVYDQKVLNPLMEHGKQGVRSLREQLSVMLDKGQEGRYRASLESALVPMDEATLHLPVRVGDYTDFYSSQDHAQNVGALFRDPANALPRNWKHLPIGYHGRASSIVLSGTDVKRPRGQSLPPKAAEIQPQFSSSAKLDYELEMAFVTFEGKGLGNSITTAEADDYIFGLCLFNDWSARDIQAWEYQPLGPFLSKSFASTVSPWIVTLDALEPYRIPGPRQEPAVLDYLQLQGDHHFDINLKVSIISQIDSAHTDFDKSNQNRCETTVTRSSTKNLYWSMSQQLAHHTINGCNIRAGDMMASGTISGSEPGSEGCLLEKTKGGKTPIGLADGTSRAFLEDGDEVRLTGFAQREGGIRIGFGSAAGKIVPASE